MRRLAHEAADSGLLSPELAAGISRVKGVKQLGFRSGNWLSAQQSSQVLKHASGDSMRAKRDYAMLAIPGQAIKTFQEVTALRPTSASQGRSSRQSTTFSGYSAATLLRSSTHSGVMCQSHPRRCKRRTTCSGGTSRRWRVCQNNRGEDSRCFAHESWHVHSTAIAIQNNVASCRSSLCRLRVVLPSRNKLLSSNFSSAAFRLASKEHFVSAEHD